MKKNQITILLILTGLLLVACGSTSNDVASLSATPTPATADESLNNEKMMMQFTECLRNEGLEVVDPIVDADGNIQKPELVEDATVTKGEWMDAYEVCGEIIENITFEKKEVDRSDQVDFYIDLAACMREEGFDLEDPTAETLDIWMTDFKTTLDWDDPDVEEAYEACAGDRGAGSNGK